MLWIEEYLIFLLKIITVFAGIIATIVACKQKSPEEENQKISIKSYQKQLITITNLINKTTGEKKTKKAKKDKKAKKATKANLFVIKFKGDIKASRTKALALEITSIINSASPKQDKVLLEIDSPGGCVHGYGQAAAELMRLKKAGISLDIAINQVAASGGYMMACVADKIIAAPFAIVGSIGVIMQIPNFNKLLKNNSIDFEQITAGKHKRTLSVFAENTQESRKKAQEQIEKTHELFQNFVSTHRPEVDLDKVATGEYWYASQAIELNLIDKIATTEEHLIEHLEKYEIYKISAHSKQGLLQKMGLQVSHTVEDILEKIMNKSILP